MKENKDSGHKCDRRKDEGKAKRMMSHFMVFAGSHLELGMVYVARRRSNVERRQSLSIAKVLDLRVSLRLSTLNQACVSCKGQGNESLGLAFVSP